MPASRSAAAARLSVSSMEAGSQRSSVPATWAVLPHETGGERVVRWPMTDETTTSDGLATERRVRIAAAGDIHCRPDMRDEVAAAFAGIADRADAVLLAGDLTTHGEPEQAEVLADACRGLDIPIVAVLGN